MPQPHLIFVYGTLKRGLCRAHLLTGQQFMGEARTQPLYRMYNCGSYPGLKLELNDGLSIVGELWSVDSECLALLDREEGVAEGLYSRLPIELATTVPAPITPAKIEAYFYVHRVDRFPDCGDCWT
jgi:gamma-glutamylaminecyclotransferase